MRASVRLAKVSILCCLGMLNGELMRRRGAHQKLLLGKRQDGAQMWGGLSLGLLRQPAFGGCRLSFAMKICLFYFFLENRRLILEPSERKKDPVIPVLFFRAILNSATVFF